MNRAAQIKAVQDPFLGQGLPSSVEAERSILGAVLLDNSVCNQAIELLKRDDFFLESHRGIFDKMIVLSERVSSIDLITLGDELRRAGEFEQIGGATYIASLIDGVPRTDNIEHYARIVKKKSMLRKLITASNQIIVRAFDEEDDADIIIDQAEQAICDIREQGGFAKASPLIPAEERHSLTPIEPIIERILYRNQLSALWGMPSGGKTHVAIDLAATVAQYAPVIYVSAEAPEDLRTVSTLGVLITMQA